jgi:hypothetical protein
MVDKQLHTDANYNKENSECGSGYCSSCLAFECLWSHRKHLGNSYWVMILHKKKVLFVTTGVNALVVLAGILALMLNIKTFNPQIEKESIFKSIAGSVLNPLEDAWKFLQGEECTAFYSGSVAQPEG